MKQFRPQILVVIMFLCTTGLFAQDPEFTQFYAAPVHLNPALAGTSECHRFAAAYRDQWPAIDRLYVTYYASYDNYFEDISSSFGLYYLGDHQANGTYNTQTISAAYAYRIDWGRFITQLAVEGSYQHIGLKRDRLVLPSEIKDDITGRVEQDGADRGWLLGGTSHADFSAGFLIYSNTLYGGVAVKHLTQPQMSLFKNNEGNPGSPFPMRITAHAGTVISFLNRYKLDYFISPEIIYSRQEDFNQINLGVYTTNSIFYFGTWFRFDSGNIKDAFGNVDAIIPYFGLYRSPFKFGYSFDLTISTLGPHRTFGAHELTFSVNICSKEKPKNYICPRFF